MKQEFTAFNQHVLQRQAEIETALDVCSHIKLVVPYTGDGVSKTASDALQALLDDEDLDEDRLVRQVHYYAADEITRDLRAEQAYSPVHTDVYLQKCSRVEEPRATYYGLARLSDLVALHRQHGKALYERNIRYYLGSSKSEVSAAIQTTLRDAPDEFFYLNNGVTAVCDHVDQRATSLRQASADTRSGAFHHQWCADGRLCCRVCGAEPAEQYRVRQGAIYPDQGTSRWRFWQTGDQGS